MKTPSCLDRPGSSAFSCALVVVAFICLPTLRLCGGMTEVRSYSGAGNNLSHPQWGAVDSPLPRKVPASYPDGDGQSFRQDPNPRTVSNRIMAQTASIVDPRGLSSFAWQWGQFLDHDISLTTADIGNGDALIPIDDVSDSLYPGIPMNRSQYITGTGVAGVPREFPNQISSYIDASNVYGSSAETMARLRAFQDGRMLTGANNLMPDDDQGSFMGGDIRANEQLALMSMHTLFMREHNRLAVEIATRATDLPNEATARDEEIYQRARKLVGAELQTITYHEFLPALLGDQMFSMESAEYDPTVDVTVANEFAHALYRFGHSMLPSQLLLVDDSGTTVDQISLRDAFFKPDMMSQAPERLGLILKGLSTEPAQQIDTRIVEDVRSFLMLEGVPGGLDLAAINIQRGRDHGLPDYNSVREAYGLPRLTDFAQITSDIQLQSDLAALYGDIDQIDLFVGALAEDHLSGASVGPLLHAALVDQFTRLRDGDRMFYEFDSDMTTLQQDANLDLAHWTLADVILANTQITQLPANVFFVPEPAAIGLLALGFGCLAVRRRVF